MLAVTAQGKGLDRLLMAITMMALSIPAYWLVRIKSALDPNGASDPFFYAEAIKGERG